MAMNGSVRLGAPSVATAILTALSPKSPTAAPGIPTALTPPPSVNPGEVAALASGIGVFVAGTQVKGDGGMLMKIIGVVTAIVSGYVISVKKGVIPDVVNAGIPSPSNPTGGSSLGPLKPLQPGAPGAAGKPTAASNAAQIVAPFAPVIQRVLGPSPSQQQQQSAAQQQKLIQASSPVAAAGAKAVASGGGTAPAAGGSGSGIVTQADLEKSLQTPSNMPLNNPYGIVTEADLMNAKPGAAVNPYGLVTQADIETSSGVSTSPIPGMVTAIDEGSSSEAPSIPGIVVPSDFATAPSAPEPVSESFVTDLDLAGIANG